MNAVLLANLGDRETANRLARYSSGDEVMNYARFAVALVGDDLLAMQGARAELAQDPTEHSLLAEVDTWLAIRAGDHEAALKALGKRFSEGGEPFVEDYSWYLLSAWLHKQQGEMEESRRLLGKLEPFLQTRGFESAEIEFARVDWLAINGRGEEALELLQSLVEKGYRPFLSQGYNAAGFPLALNPYLAPWSATPRFRAIADELDRRAAAIREQISLWNREHPEDAALWQLPFAGGAVSGFLTPHSPDR
jgi:hypothetical protein